MGAELSGSSAKRERRKAGAARSGSGAKREMQVLELEIDAEAFAPDFDPSVWAEQIHSAESIKCPSTHAHARARTHTAATHKPPRRVSSLRRS